jgi:hypothetical protein
LLSRLFEVFQFLFRHDLETEGQSINGNLVEASMGLQATSHESLREEETG